MAPLTSRTRWLLIRLFALVGITILPFTPGGQAYWSYYLAEKHTAKLRPILQGDVRFAHVTLESDFGMGGALVLKGEVKNDEDKIALKKVAADSEPPVKIWYFVRTTAENTVAGLNHAAGQ